MPREVILAAIGVVCFVAAACGGSDDRPSPRSDTVNVGETSLLLADWNDRTLRPLDPLSLDPVPGYLPFSLGHWSDFLGSPDGRMLAAVFGPDETYVGQLHFFNLDTWTEEFIPEQPSGPLRPSAWSADSRYLYAATDREIWVADTERQETRLLARFEFWFDEIFVAPDGGTLYVFAVEESDPTAFLVEGDPWIAEVDSRTGEVRRRVTLPGVTIGQRKERGSDGEFYATYIPARVMSPGGDWLYVADSNSDEITVVNLPKMIVEQTVEPRAAESLFDRAGAFLRGLLVGDAEAKGGEYVSKQALLSPDGAMLYLTGSRDGRPDGDSEGMTPLGLRVIDTLTMRVVHEEVGIGAIGVSAGGERVLATGWGHSWTRTADTEYWPDKYYGTGLRIFDASSGVVRAHVSPDAIYQTVLPGPDKRYTYLVSDEIVTLDLEARRTLAGYTPRYRITVVDLDGFEVVGEKVFDSAIELVPVVGP